jgi:hypothetical protein
MSSYVPRRYTIMATVQSSVMWRFTDISKIHWASLFRAEEQAKQLARGKQTLSSATSLAHFTTLKASLFISTAVRTSI